MVDICRLCASLRKMDVLVTVKDENDEICEKILKCCQVKIKIIDALPKFICLECILQLNNSHKFYTKVHEAQETLQALYPDSHKTTHTSLKRTLSAQIDNSKNFLNAREKENEQNITKETTNIEDNKQQPVNLEEPFLEQSAATEEEFKIDEEESEQIVEYIEDISNCEKTIYDDHFEIMDQTAGKLEDLETNESPKEDNLIEQIDELNESEEDDINKTDAQYALDISKGKFLQSNKVIERLSDLLSDDDVNIEIEYMEHLEGEEFGDDCNNGMDDTVENEINTKHELEITSWKNYKFLCFICDDIFTSFIDLKAHITHEHKINQLEKLKYKCYDCKKIISLYSYFLNHVRARHHPSLKLKCDGCDLSCQNFEELTHHRNYNCAEMVYFTRTATCNKCFKSFNNTNGLLNHIKFQHDPTSKVTFMCTQCDKGFQYKSCLKAHELLHTDIKNFSCDYCGKSFHTKLRLEQHLYVHVDIKSYPCNICDKSYKTFRSLDDHRKLHTNEKSFVCQFCSKAFNRKIQKITHERSHTGEEPYSCEKCDKKFRYRSALFVHNKIHTGNKPYKCAYCEKTFADSSNRNKHVRRMHSVDKMQENKTE